MILDRENDYLPVIPVTETLLFPYVVRSIGVETPIGIAAAEHAYSTKDRRVLVAGLRDAGCDERLGSSPFTPAAVRGAHKTGPHTPRAEQLYQVATEGVVSRVMAKTGSRLQVILQGTERAVIEDIKVKDIMRARIRRSPMPGSGTSARLEALERSVVELAGKILMGRPDNPGGEVRDIVSRAEGPTRIYFLAAMLTFEMKKEQAILQAGSCREALELIHAYLMHEHEVLNIRDKINSESKAELNKEQREYVLRQQLQIIKKELGEEDPEMRDQHMLRRKADEPQLPPDVRERANYELDRLERLPPSAPEHGVIRSYLDCLLELPWEKPPKRMINLHAARLTLQHDHHGLEDVKARILEHLAVLKLNAHAKAPIICFDGPPGVGKTSLGQSIARALGRKFERISLGGLHDESELRGHRRTYIGAMPGRIIQALRRAKAPDPVILLDEVDKIGRDFRSDPGAALLEILDPEQNKIFRDNYVELPFDLSKVMFITTANSTAPIPRPLLDRMEVIHISGYSEEEKVQIGHKFLVPRQIRECGLTPDQLPIGDATLREIVCRFTREAGVRQLERAIGRLARKAALRVAEGYFGVLQLRPEELDDVLGAEMYRPEELRSDLFPGVAPGLAWTEAGGDILYIETSLLPRGQGLVLTGQLGEVMQESARAALSWVLEHAEQLGIDPMRAAKTGVHLHVPSGAIPKDGPSAGLTMIAALASAFLRQRWRADIAMTGEITLSGLVLPVGGIKEKVLAARRAGVRRVILPRANYRDLRDVPAGVREELEISFVERVDEIFAIGLTAQLALASSG